MNRFVTYLSCMTKDYTGPRRSIGSRKSFRCRVVACIAVDLVFKTALAPVAAASTMLMAGAGGPSPTRDVAPSPGTGPAPAPSTATAVGQNKPTVARPGDAVPELWTPKSAVVLETNPPLAAASLFDGDSMTGFTSRAGETGAVRLELGAAREVIGVGVHGDGRAKIAIYAEDAGGARTLIRGGRDAATKLEVDHWAQLVLDRPTKTSALIVQWTASSGAATISELALWVAGRSSQALAEAALADRLVTELPENARAATAVPWTASVARVTVNGAVSAKFDVTLHDDPLLGRAFLVYELDKKAHWTGVARSINGHVVRGGYRADAKGLGGVQVEEINPAWLRSGDNSILFQPTLNEDGRGYSINNVRIVSVPRGTEPVAAPGARMALSDGDLATGLGGPGAHTASLSVRADREPAFLSFYLDQPTGGTLTVSGDGGWSNRKGQVNVELAGRPAGWQTVPVAGVLPTTTGALRLRVRGDKESTGQVSEARVVWFPALTAQAELTVAYPLHGECQDHKTYLRGFASGTGRLQKPQLSVDGQPMIGKIDADGSFEANVEEPAGVKGKPWSVRLEVATADGGHRTRTVPVDACVETPKGRIIGVSPPVEDVGAPYGAVVSPQKAATLSFAGAKIDIPAGAVDSDVRVTMRALDRGQVPPIQSEMENVTGSGGALRFGPHGLKFKKPVKVTLPIDAARMPPGMNEMDVVAFFYDEATSEWTQLPKVLGRPDRVIAETTHFTDFIASTIKTPEHPDMQQFNPNTMKGVKVGEPGAGITMIEPPQASSSGSARLSYPIETPPARNGIGPKLALSYDSDRVNGNGWLGIGWDLRMSSIDIDTRFGVPKYDGTDVYSLDGQLLAPTGTSGTTTTYIRRIESSFDLIQRQGSGPTAYFWTVTDKNGTVYTYGTSSATFKSRLSNPRTGQPGFGNIFRWYLEQVKDMYGNVMTITYQHDTYTTGTGATLETYDEVYPSAIDYTSNANTGLAANYHVTFSLDPVGRRPDTMINARAGFLVSTRRRLTDIMVKSGTTLVRQYHFSYNDWDENLNQSIPQNLLDTLNKSVLSAVALWGVQGDKTSELYRHTFEYQKAPAGSAMFTSQITPDGKQMYGNMWQQVPPPGNGGQTRPVNGLAHSNDNLIGGSVSLGVGFPTISATGSFGMDSGSSSPDLAFLGITGEGMPDQIDLNGFVSQFTLVGRDPNDRIVPSGVAGLPFLGGTDRWGFTAGGNVSVLQGFGGVGLSYSRHVSNDRSIFTDINGDGFPDLAVEQGGTVLAYVNDGKRGFTQKPWTGYNLSNSPFSTASRVTNSTVTQAYFNTDPLVRWVAPFGGTVTINASATKITSTGDDVRVDFYVANDPVRSTTISAGDLSPHALASNLSHTINAGDRIYMRLAALGNGISDGAVFSTSIVYSPPGGRSTSELDPSGMPIFSYSIASDGRVAGPANQPFHLTGDGDISVARCFLKNPTPDDVKASYVIRDKNGAVVKRFDQTFFAATSNPTTPFCFATSVLPPLASDSRLATIPKTQVCADGTSCSVKQDQSIALEFTSDSPFDRLAMRVAFPFTTIATISYSRYCRLGFCGAPQRNTANFTYTIPGDPYSAFPVPAGDITWGRDSDNSIPPYYQTYTQRIYNNGTTATTNAPRFFSAPSSSVTFGGSVVTSTTLTEDVVVQIQGVNKLHAKLRIPKGTAGGRSFSVTPAACAVTSDCEQGRTCSAGQCIGPATVTAGEPIYFTISSPTVIGGNVSWSPTVNGTAVSSLQINSAILDPTYDNNLGPSHDPLSGGFHRWFYGDWNDSIGFSDSLIVRTSALPQNTDPAIGMLRLGSSDGDYWQGRGGTQFTPGGGSFVGIPGRVNNPSATATDGSGSSALRVADTWNVSLQASLAGVTAGVNGGDATTQVDFLDLNGDRFPDSLTLGGVQYNDGAGTFSARTPLDMTLGDATEIRRISNASLQGGVAISSPSSRQQINESDGDGSTKKLSGTVSVSASADYGVSSTRIDLVDVNGDGLLDHVREEPGNGGTLRVRLNLGYGFSNEVDWNAAAWSQSSAFPVLNWPALTNFVPVAQIFNVLNKVTGSPAGTDVVRLQDTGTNGINLGGGFGPVGGGGGPTYSVTRTWVDLIDINGDGLPDQVLKVPGDTTLHVKLNTGTAFASEQSWTLPVWKAPTGANFTFLTPDGLSFSTIDGWGKNLSFQICFIVCFGLSGFESDSHGGPSVQFEDIDGDGKPDQVMKVPDDPTVYAKLNTIGQTNLLTAVNRPLGSRVEISYARSGNHVDLASGINMPSNQWAMSGAVIHNMYSGEVVNGCTWSGGGAHQMPDAPVIETFTYANSDGYGTGYFDPLERENLGYASAKTVYPCEDQGTSIARAYFNQSYYLHGLENSTTWFQNDAAATQLRENLTQYSDPSGKIAEQQPPRTGTWLPTPTTSFTFINEATGLKDHLVTRKYDTSGNLTDVIDQGDLDIHDGSDTFNYHIDYAHPATNITVPQTITARTGSTTTGGTLLAKRTVGTFDPGGKPKTITDVIANGKDPNTGALRTEAAPGNATWTFTYDAYGNVQTTASPPPGGTSTNRTVQYTYDAATQTYPTTTAETDTGATYSASATYDLRFGLPATVTDVAGAPQQVCYDNYGRPTKVFAPSDLAAGFVSCTGTNTPTIAVSYSEGPHTGGTSFAETLPAWSMATHVSAVPGEGSLPNGTVTPKSLHTVNFVDGVQQSVEVKKDITRDDGTGSKADGMSVSGAKIFDTRGRIYQQGQPTFASGTGSTAFVPVTMTNPIQYAYDVLGRLRQEQHPDNGDIATTTISYQMGVSPVDGRSYVVKLTSDPLNSFDPTFHYKAEYRTVRDEMKLLAQPTLINGNVTTLYTSYDYDLLSRVVKVTDAKLPTGNVTTAQYDTVGNLVSLTSPDAGTREWRYCVSGYVCAELSPNITKAASNPIKYTYDHDRLKTVAYPHDTAVTYVYGASTETGAANSYRANRVKQRTDEAGQFTYAYDALGDVASETAVLKNQMAMVVGTNYQSYQTSYKWDNFGRLIDVTIPATNSNGVNTPGETIRYGYDNGGAVASAIGTAGTTNFNYVNHVGYDEFGETVRITYGNSAFSTYTYYPDTRRLMTANTTIKDISTQPARLAQSLSYNYDLVGNLTARTQLLPYDTVLTDPVPVGGNNTGQLYYDPLNQLDHEDLYSQVKSTEAYSASVDISYDEIGNITTKSQFDNKYTYDSNGNLTGTTPQPQDSYTFMPSYAGLPHAASTIAESRSSGNTTRTLTYDFDGNLTTWVNGTTKRGVTWSDTDRVRTVCSGTPSNCPLISQALYAADGTRTHNKITNNTTSSETIYVNQYLTVRGGLLPTKHVYLGDIRIASKVEGSGSPKTFWYHSDNVQSTQYVTTTGQVLTQHLEYFPGGEIWREENGTAISAVASVEHATAFTGKELDPLSGYYYFGARYYDPQVQSWLSPDPILSTYVKRGADGLAPKNLGLYTYSWNSPAVVRDPDGREAKKQPSARIPNPPAPPARSFATDGTSGHGNDGAGGGSGAMERLDPAILEKRIADFLSRPAAPAPDQNEQVVRDVGGYFYAGPRWRVDSEATHVESENWVVTKMAADSSILGAYYAAAHRNDPDTAHVRAGASLFPTIESFIGIMNAEKHRAMQGAEQEPFMVPSNGRFQQQTFGIQRRTTPPTLSLPPLRLQ
jgi:RHS repeat-associated protein